MCANWTEWPGDNRDMSPDRNNRYQIDNVGLQIGLGLPLQVVGVSLMDFNSPRQYGNRDQGGGHRRNHNQQNGSKKLEIQQTCDGIPIRKLYVTNISIETQRSDLKEIFNHYGVMNQIYMGISKNDTNKQFAFITFVNPLDAAKVLLKERFHDMRGRTMYVMPADSWHQPQELPDGSIDWRTSKKTPARQEEGNEEDEEQSTEETPSRVEVEINEGSLNMLNDDCLLHIFSFLTLKQMTGVERVCKRWQALSTHVWQCLHELHLREDGPFSEIVRNTKMLDQYLKRCGSSLTTLDLMTETHEFNETTLALVAKYCEKLEVLRVKNLKVANRSLAHLGRTCTKLKELTMEDCVRVDDNDLNSLLPKCSDLRVLDICNMKLFSGKCLANVTGPISNLRLSNNRHIDFALLIEGLHKMSSTLETLTLNDYNLLPRRVVKDIASVTPNLTSFTLSRCWLAGDSQSLLALGQLKKLTTLNLNLNNSVNDTVLSTIVDGCKELTTLNLCACGEGYNDMVTTKGLSMLPQLPKLRHLDISYLEAVNNKAMKDIITRKSKLKSLVCRGCLDLNDEGTERVVTLCNELELFDVSGCYRVTDKTAETALASVKMRTNSIPLHMVVGGTQIKTFAAPNEVPLLTVDLRDLTEEFPRLDVEEMFFPPTDSEEEEEHGHHCERFVFNFYDICDNCCSSDEHSMDCDYYNYYDCDY